MNNGQGAVIILAWMVTMLFPTLIWGIEPMAFGLIAVGVPLGVLVLFYTGWKWYFFTRFLKEGGLPRPASKTSESAMEELERAIGGKLPVVLRNAYLDGSIADLVLPVTFEAQFGEEVIVEFIAADAEANEKLTRWHNLSRTAFIFAGDDFGNYFFVLGANEAVYYWDHDGGDVTMRFKTAREMWDVIGAKTG